MSHDMTLPFMSSCIPLLTGEVMAYGDASGPSNYTPTTKLHYLKLIALKGILTTYADREAACVNP